jgi:hypothetical protein
MDGSYFAQVLRHFPQAFQSTAGKLGQVDTKKHLMNLQYYVLVKASLNTNETYNEFGNTYG